MLFDIHSDDDDFLGNSPKKSLPSFFGDGIASSSRPPFLPYNGASGFDAPPEDEPHGRGPTKSLTGTPGFDFDEDDEEQIRERAAAAARPRSGKFKETSARAWDSFLQTLGVRRKIEVGGERTIYINDQAMNNQFKYCNNYVSTGKYNLVTFVPKFLAGVSLLSPPYRSDAVCADFESIRNLKNNSRNTPTSSSCSPRQSCRFQACHPPTDTLPFYPYPSSYSWQRSRKYKKISSVIRVTES